MELKGCGTLDLRELISASSTARFRCNSATCSRNRASTIRVDGQTSSSVVTCQHRLETTSGHQSHIICLFVL
eukprot:2315164-Rhodomonas_salina.1